MYESYFGMTCRPFRAAPDARVFAEVGKTQEALEQLEVWVRDGQGLALLTAPAGFGKTMICRKLVEDLQDEFVPVFLANSNFPTREALLQAVLYELQQPYAHMSEQELRLQLVNAVHQVAESHEAVLLIVDEAHQLDCCVIEELRMIADLSQDGRSLVRILLSGQLALEERLAEPELDALRQRIRTHAILEPLSRRDSAALILQCLQHAGVDATEILTEESLELICHASDGSPRCLNQLADQCLQRTFRAEARLVTGQTVREALQDLKQLPLQWNDLPPIAEPVDSLPEAQSSDDDMTVPAGATGSAETPLPEADDTALPQDASERPANPSSPQQDRNGMHSESEPDKSEPTTAGDQPTAISEPESSEPGSDVSVMENVTVMEFGADLDDPAPAESCEPAEVIDAAEQSSTTSDDIRQESDMGSEDSTETVSETVSETVPIRIDRTVCREEDGYWEEPIVDRYTLIDAGRTVPPAQEIPEFDDPGAACLGPLDCRSALERRAMRGFAAPGIGALDCEPGQESGDADTAAPAGPSEDRADVSGADVSGTESGHDESRDRSATPSISDAIASEVFDTGREALEDVYSEESSAPDELIAEIMPALDSLVSELDGFRFDCHADVVCPEQTDHASIEREIRDLVSETRADVQRALRGQSSVLPGAPRGVRQFDVVQPEDADDQTGSDGSTSGQSKRQPSDSGRDSDWGTGREFGQREDPYARLFSRLRQRRNDGGRDE